MREKCLIFQQIDVLLARVRHVFVLAEGLLVFIIVVVVVIIHLHIVVIVGEQRRF